jgi:hypothetical protein
VAFANTPDKIGERLAQLSPCDKYAGTSHWDEFCPCEVGILYKLYVTLKDRCKQLEQQVKELKKTVRRYRKEPQPL